MSLLPRRRRASAPPRCRAGVSAWPGPRSVLIADRNWRGPAASGPRCCSPTTVLPRRPRGVVPHADFRETLATTWSAPPALQPLGHHLTLDAPAGLLAAAAVPVEAYAGAELRFTPAAAEPTDQPAEPASRRQPAAAARPRAAAARQPSRRRRLAATATAQR